MTHTWVNIGGVHHIIAHRCRRSLCGRWGFVESSDDELPPKAVEPRKRGDCQCCVRKWNAAIAARQTA